MSTTPDSQPPFVGLTGGLGAGKSTALEALRGLGAEVLSTDSVVHELYAGERVRDAVLGRWGATVMRDGSVDRAAVAQRVFADPSEREWLEGMLWPLVAQRVAAWRVQVSTRRPPPRAVVVETPLLFEAAMEGVYDATVAVVSAEGVRRERAAARGHALVDERTARQLSQDEKASRATFAVHNDGSVAELERELSAILDKLDR